MVCPRCTCILSSHKGIVPFWLHERLEMLDPESVRRYRPFPEGTAPKAYSDDSDSMDWPLEYVSVSDYYELLALYRGSEEEIDRLHREAAGESI